jgi:TldD protein
MAFCFCSEVGLDFSSLPLEETLKKVLRNYTYADIFVEKKRGFRIRFENGKIELILLLNDEGFGIRGIKGEEVAYFYSTGITPDRFLEGADSLKEGRSHGFEGGSLSFKEEKLHSIENVLEEIKSCSRVLERKEVLSSSIFYEFVEREIGIFSKRGLVNELQRREFVFSRVLVSDGKIYQTGYETEGASSDFPLKGINLAGVVEKSLERALTNLKASPPPLGRMPVVIGGEAGGTMIHEAVGHGFEADHVLKKSSVYEGKIGEAVASPLITVVDDPTIEGKRGSYLYDDEGNPSQRVLLIEKGILRDYLYDMLWALKSGRESNGHGRRESYKYLPIPRMSNTFIERGNMKKEDVIKGVWKGVYVKKMGGGEVNTVNGDFMFHVLEGYRIENGKIGEPIQNFSISGNGPEILKIIDAVGDDVGWSVGNCGKEGQLVPVSDGMPTIRIPEMVVGGILR